MSKEQIEEMAKAMCGNGMLNGKCTLDGEPCNLECVYGCCAEKLYAKGYCKQSEAEKSKGCEYCKGRAYTKKPLTVITKYGRRIELVFEFCPNCGRKMKGGE